MKFREIARNSIVTVGCVVIAIGGVFLAGKVGNKFTETIEKEHQEIRTEIRKESSAYNEGKARNLSLYKQEYDRAENNEERESIKNFIINEFAEYDYNKIENEMLRTFLIDVLNNNI